MEDQKTIKERLPRALSPADLFRMNIKTIGWGGEWKKVLGDPARTGVWILWGDSGSGKTSFALQLAKELTKYGKVAYNSLEQGASLSMKEALMRHKFGEVKRGHFLLISERLKDLSKRLERRQSPDFVIIDSLQYTKAKYTDYQKFKEAHPNKLIIFVSHAEGAKARGPVAQSIVYDAEMKIFVEGYRAISKGRFISENGAFYTVWEEGATKYWLSNDNKE